MSVQPFWIILRSPDGNFATYEARNGTATIGQADDIDLPVVMAEAGQVFRIVSGENGPEAHDLTAAHRVSVNGQLIQRALTLSDGTKLMLPGFTSLYIFTHADSYTRFLKMWQPVDLSEHVPTQSTQQRTGNETEQMYQPPLDDEPS